MARRREPTNSTRTGTPTPAPSRSNSWDFFRDLASETMHAPPHQVPDYSSLGVRAPGMAGPAAKQQAGVTTARAANSAGSSLVRPRCMSGDRERIVWTTRTCETDRYLLGGANQGDQDDPFYVPDLTTRQSGFSARRRHPLETRPSGAPTSQGTTNSPRSLLIGEAYLGKPTTRSDGALVFQAEDRVYYMISSGCEPGLLGSHKRWADIVLDLTNPAFGQNRKLLAATIQEIWNADSLPVSLDIHLDHSTNVIRHWAPENLLRLTDQQFDQIEDLMVRLDGLKSLDETFRDPFPSNVMVLVPKQDERGRVTRDYSTRCTSENWDEAPSLTRITESIASGSSVRAPNRARQSIERMSRVLDGYLYV